MLPIDWNAATKYAGLLQIAESVQPNADYSQNDKDHVSAAGYTFLQTVYGDDLATDVQSLQDRVCSANRGNQFLFRRNAHESERYDVTQMRVDEWTGAEHI
jgi:hypothetical protein